MHEATIAQSILNIAADRLSLATNADTVSNIEVRIGEFRNVEVDCLQFAFDNLKGSFAGCQNSRLRIETILASALCRDCAECYHPNFERGFRCNDCNGGIAKLIAGEELDVVRIILESSTKEYGKYA